MSNPTNVDQIVSIADASSEPTKRGEGLPESPACLDKPLIKPSDTSANQQALMLGPPRDPTPPPPPPPPSAL